jgi:hypothetical protein
MRRFVANPDDTLEGLLNEPNDDNDDTFLAYGANQLVSDRPDVCCTARKTREQWGKPKRLSRLWVLSDLNLEAVPHPESYRPERPKFDVVVVAGDIWEGDPRRAPTDNRAATVALSLSL